MSAQDCWEVLVRRDDPTVTEVRAGSTEPLEPGQVRLAVEKFAVTANNVTYARLGDSELPFFDVFPAADGYARVPVWGYARAEASRHPDVAVGTRYFGFLPMSSHHTTWITPTDRGFVDAAPQRAFLHDWYRTYPLGEVPDELDDLRTLVRPLYPASFALADFLVEHGAAGVARAVVSSASSRTALGLAERLRDDRPLELVGLTAARHRDFVTGLGLYDRVLTYDEVSTLPARTSTVLLDFTGQPAALADQCGHLAPGLVHTAQVGYTHAGGTMELPELPGPAPEIFFTPDVEQKARAAEGADRHHARYAAAEERFLRSTTDWLRVDRRRGPEAAAAAFLDALRGSASPQVATVVIG
ncbi:DUF2855 family protein [Micromonospora cathayae]|uniref:DUF2855 family protein n=1 Tax=Micromonospora cathayae TaxID=3028804 RepID=A0ABY7ZKG8_9ACTN|nr:DUF2855 family protein [Micromonospora sp. HUAS 3]WDZ83482.1 DUF2855 family protein [Micromonospora sp. HUAS 3]